VPKYAAGGEPRATENEERTDSREIATQRFLRSRACTTRGAASRLGRETDAFRGEGSRQKNTRKGTGASLDGERLVALSFRSPS
jgi:hypothetical protein